MGIARRAIPFILAAAVIVPAGCKKSQGSGNFSSIATGFKASWLMPDGLAEDPSAKVSANNSSDYATCMIQGVARCDKPFDTSAMSAQLDKFIRSTMTDAGANNIKVDKPQESGKMFTRTVCYQYGDKTGQIDLIFSPAPGGKTVDYYIFVQEMPESRPAGKGG